MMETKPARTFRERDQTLMNENNEAGACSNMCTHNDHDNCNRRPSLSSAIRPHLPGPRLSGKYRRQKSTERQWRNQCVQHGYECDFLLGNSLPQTV